MNYSHLHAIPGFRMLAQKLGQDALAIPVVSAVRSMAFAEAEYVFSDWCPLNWIYMVLIYNENNPIQRMIVGLSVCLK